MWAAPEGAPARPGRRKTRKSLGDKRKELGEEHISEITRLYTEALAILDTAENGGTHDLADMPVYDDAAFGNAIVAAMLEGG